MADKKKKDNSDSSSEEEEPENLSYKIIILGNSRVGKTQVVCRYCDEIFSKQYKKTIGVDFFQKRLELNPEINVSLQLWDVDGEAISGKMLDTYVHDANAIVFVYDVTDLESFKAVEYWNREVSLVTKHNQPGSDKDAPIRLLLGNKYDMQHLGKVDADTHNTWAKDHKMEPYMGSAKTGDQINQMFFKVAADLAGVKVTKDQIEAQRQYVEQIEPSKSLQMKGAAAGQRALAKQLEMTPEEKIDSAVRKESKMCQIF